MGAGTSSGNSRRGRGGIIGINVTPMVDVVLVLLVIMMVSANYIVSQSIKVELPKVANSDEGAASVAAATIARNGQLYFNDQPVSEPQLREKLTTAFGANAELNLVVTADSNVSHGVVMHVVDLARGVGITKFAINVEHAE